MDDTVQGLNDPMGLVDRAQSPAAERTASRDEAPAHPPGAVLSLKQAMRRARFDDAERSGAVADLRAARLGRLEVLQEALRPLIAQIPGDVDCFDIGIMPGVNPRLFIDMIGFVEMARDPRVYVFLQDTRHGRVKLAESESVGVIVEATTQYVARRLLERDKALAADDEAPRQTIASTRAEPKPQRAEPAQTELSRPRRQDRSSVATILGATFAFLIDVLGSIAFFSILAGIAWVIWQNLKQ